MSASLCPGITTKTPVGAADHKAALFPQNKESLSLEIVAWNMSTRRRRCYIRPTQVRERSYGEQLVRCTCFCLQAWLISCKLGDRVTGREAQMSCCLDLRCCLRASPDPLPSFSLSALWSPIQMIRDPSYFSIWLQILRTQVVTYSSTNAKRSCLYYNERFPENRDLLASGPWDELIPSSCCVLLHPLPAPISG